MVKNNLKKKIIYSVVCFTLFFQQIGFAQMASELNIAGHLANMHSGISIDKFRPLHLRYFSYDLNSDNFKFLFDKGDFEKGLSPFKEEIQTLLKYFLIGITLPDSKFWVNLRPDSEDQIIEPELEQTDLGKVLLEADLQLKKDTAKYTSPETPEGREYWNKLYKKAEELFGYESITIPTLTRPWIVPGEIIIRETEESAFIYKSTLKVMLEEDYLNVTKSPSHQVTSETYSFKDPRLKELNAYSSQLIRELIIPKLTKEVNTSKRYASLRQVFYSLILSRWFKARFKGLSPQGTDPFYVNLIDSGNLNGLTSKDSWSKTTYFKEYQKSFNNGEYNLKEPVYTPTGQVIRSYFSGGIKGPTIGDVSGVGAVGGGVVPTNRNLIPGALGPSGVSEPAAASPVVEPPNEKVEPQVILQRAADYEFSGLPQEIELPRVWGQPANAVPTQIRQLSDGSYVVIYVNHPFVPIRTSTSAVRSSRQVIIIIDRDGNWTRFSYMPFTKNFSLTDREGNPMSSKPDIGRIIRYLSGRRIIGEEIDFIESAKKRISEEVMEQLNNLPLLPGQVSDKKIASHLVPQLVNDIMPLLMQMSAEDFAKTIGRLRSQGYEVRKQLANEFSKWADAHSDANPLITSEEKQRRILVIRGLVRSTDEAASSPVSLKEIKDFVERLTWTVQIGEEKTTHTLRVLYGDPEKDEIVKLWLRGRDRAYRADVTGGRLGIDRVVSHFFVISDNTPPTDLLKFVHNELLAFEEEGTLPLDKNIKAAIINKLDELEKGTASSPVSVLRFSKTFQARNDMIAFSAAFLRGEQKLVVYRVKPESFKEEDAALDKALFAGRVKKEPIFEIVFDKQDVIRLIPLIESGSITENEARGNNLRFSHEGNLIELAVNPKSVSFTSYVQGEYEVFEEPVPKGDTGATSSPVSQTETLSGYPGASFDNQFTGRVDLKLLATEVGGDRRPQDDRNGSLTVEGDRVVLRVGEESETWPVGDVHQPNALRHRKIIVEKQDDKGVFKLRITQGEILPIGLQVRVPDLEITWQAPAESGAASSPVVTVQGHKDTPLSGMKFSVKTITWRQGYEPIGDLENRILRVLVSREVADHIQKVEGKLFIMDTPLGLRLEGKDGIEKDLYLKLNDIKTGIVEGIVIAYSKIDPRILAAIEIPAKIDVSVEPVASSPVVTVEEGKPLVMKRDSTRGEVQQTIDVSSVSRGKGRLSVYQIYTYGTTKEMWLFDMRTDRGSLVLTPEGRGNSGIKRTGFNQWEYRSGISFEPPIMRISFDSLRDTLSITLTPLTSDSQTDTFEIRAGKPSTSSPVGKTEGREKKDEGRTASSPVNQNAVKARGLIENQSFQVAVRDIRQKIKKWIDQEKIDAVDGLYGLVVPTSLGLQHYIEIISSAFMEAFRGTSPSDITELNRDLQGLQESVRPVVEALRLFRTPLFDKRTVDEGLQIISYHLSNLERNLHALANTASGKQEGASSPVRTVKGQSPSTLEIGRTGTVPTDVGGIDFRVMNIVTQPLVSSSSVNLRLPELTNLAEFNLDEELRQIQNMLVAGIVPSGERIKEFLAACQQKGEWDIRIADIISCLIEICRLEEDNVSETPLEIKEALIIADSGNLGS